MTKRIIVIEDSMTFCERICNMLKRQGWETSKAYNMRKGMELVREVDEFTIVLSDLRLPDGDGIQLLEWMWENGYENQVVILLSDSQDQYAGVLKDWFKTIVIRKE